MVEIILSSSLIPWISQETLNFIASHWQSLASIAVVLLISVTLISLGLINRNRANDEYEPQDLIEARFAELNNLEAKYVKIEKWTRRSGDGVLCFRYTTGPRAKA